MPSPHVRTVVGRGRVRVGPFIHWPQVLEEMGLDADAVLERAGLERTVFDDPENVTSFATVGRLFEESDRAGAPATLASTIGARSRLSALGPVGLMMQSSPTVGHALDVLARYYRTHDGGSVISVDIDGRVATLRYKIIVSDVGALERIYVLVLALGMSYLRAMLGGAWRAREVLLPFARPGDVAPLRSAFNAPLRFNTEAAGLVLRTSDLAVPLATADTFLLAMMRDRLQQIASLVDADLPDRARHRVASTIYSERWNVGMLATRLGISPRTLNRRLADAGTSFRALREEARRDAACQLLSSTDKTTGEIAAILQYSDQSAFTRAFRRWQGVAPTQWRTSHRATGRPVTA